MIKPKYTIDDYIEKCKSLNLEYVGKHTVKKRGTMIEFICPKHRDKGTQECDWSHFKTYTKGCRFCSGRGATTEEIQSRVKNKNVILISEYKGNEKPIKCKCKVCDGEWTTIPKILLTNGCGCPICAMSKPEKALLSILDKLNIKYIPQKDFENCKYKRKLKFDAYAPDLNIAFEYNGQQHYKPVDFYSSKDEEKVNAIFDTIQTRDEIKKNFCKENGIRLITIPYWEEENMENYIKEQLKEK